MNHNLTAAISAISQAGLTESLITEIGKRGIDPLEISMEPGHAWGNNGRAIVALTGPEFGRTAAEIIFTNKCHFGAKVSGAHISTDLRAKIEEAYKAIISA